MESLLCILLLVLALLVYFSNRQNAVNRWCALAASIFWLGLAKEAIAYNLIPFLEKTLAVEGLGEYFIIPYSIMTWAPYTLAVPTTLLFALTFGGQCPPPTLRWLLYLPAALLSCIYHPWQYPIYQHGNTTFWLIFTCYGILGCAVFVFLMLRAVKRETDAAARTQKKLVISVLLPPIVFCVFSIFLPHLFQLTRLNKLWQINALILLASIAFYIVVAFRGGMMGLRLTGESYRWNSDMGLIRRGVSYTGHMIKNQTAKMAWCVENLTAQFDAQGSMPPEELAILGRSITALQNYTEKAARYANTIALSEAEHPLDEMLGDAFSLCARSSEAEASLRLTGVSGVCWICDRTHMTEVFLNLFANALEAMTVPAPIEVSWVPGRGNSAFTLCVADHGSGMRPEDAARIFTPYYTTKNSPFNLGLGLSYCKNVIEKHGGTVEARSKPGKGTTICIRMPASRVLITCKEGGKEAMLRA